MPFPNLVFAHLTEAERAAADKVESCHEDVVKASDSRWLHFAKLPMSWCWLHCSALCQST